jgi:hypothetical protein
MLEPNFDVYDLKKFVLFEVTTVRLNFTENPAMLDISRPPQADFCKQGGAFYSTNMVFAFANNLWDCPVRDKMLVEREIKIIESPVRDAMYFYRTTMI